jgi:RimJ/RimL family protein N-acetyltransferase
VIETERLTLRRWRAEDLDPYAALMADPEVTDWLGGGQTRAQAEAAAAAFEAEIERLGMGTLALARKDDGALVGSAGLRPVRADIPLAPAVEIVWRLARPAWGRGYATEAALALLADGFSRHGLKEIVAFTGEANLRSRAVMERISMVRDPARDFEHPKMPMGHPLRPHVVYTAHSLRKGA